MGVNKHNLYGVQHVKCTFTIDVAILLPGISPKDIFINVSKDYVYHCWADCLQWKLETYMYANKGLVKATMVHSYNEISSYYKKQDSTMC